MSWLSRWFRGPPLPAANREYWADPSRYDAYWDKRAQSAAGLIAPGSRVLDLGCGQQALMRFLPPGCRYTPADLTRWDESVIVVDLDTGEFPEGEYDVIAILGVLYYLAEPEAVLARARRSATLLIADYVHPHTGDVRRRRELRWINEYSEHDLDAMLTRAGWTRKPIRRTPGAQAGGRRGKISKNSPASFRSSRAATRAGIHNRRPA